MSPPHWVAPRPPTGTLLKWSPRENVPAMRLFSGLAVKGGAGRTAVPELTLEGDVSCLPPTWGTGGRWTPQQHLGEKSSVRWVCREACWGHAPAEDAPHPPLSSQPCPVPQLQSLAGASGRCR